MLSRETFTPGSIEHEGFRMFSQANPPASYEDALSAENVVRFSPNHLQTLMLFAQGLTYEEIGRRFSVARCTIQSELELLRRKIAAETTVQLLDYALETEQIPVAEVTKDFDFNLFQTLPAQDKKIVAEISGRAHLPEGHKRIANRTNKSQQTIKNHVSSILRSLGLKNHVQLRLYGKYLPEDIAKDAA